MFKGQNSKVEYKIQLNLVCFDPERHNVWMLICLRENQWSNCDSVVRAVVHELQGQFPFPYAEVSLDKTPKPHSRAIIPTFALPFRQTGTLHSEGKEHEMEYKV